MTTQRGRHQHSPATVLDLQDALVKRRKDGLHERRVPQEDIFSEPSDRKTLKAPPLSAKDEILSLRSEVNALERSLTSLTSDWREAAFPPPVLFQACEAAREKSRSRQSEQLNKALRVQLLQQQLYLATLQRAFTESPLTEECAPLDLFRAMHQELVLKDVDSRLRISQLALRCDVTARLAPGLLASFTECSVREASLLFPCSRFSVAADAQYTYVASTLVVKIPSTMLEHVYSATLSYFFDAENENMRRYFGVSRTTTAIHQLGGIRHYARVAYFNDAGFSATCNSVVAAELLASGFTICVDFVDSDKRFPSDAQHRTRREPCIMITATPQHDPQTGQNYVLLRQMAVIRYNVLPNVRLLHDEICTAQVLSNGDLFIARICQHLHNQQVASSSNQGQHHAALETSTVVNHVPYIN